MRPRGSDGASRSIRRRGKEEPPVPKRTDIKKILILGAGPIVIGQACEFDYSGTQACKALREEGFEVVLVNSNPATIMTDPEMADRTYIEPITPSVVEQIIAVERPDALLPTLGGQTGLNVGLALAESGVLERLRLPAHRRLGRGDPDGRGPRPVQGRHGGDRPGERPERPGALDRGSPRRSATRSACPACSGPASRWAARAAGSPTTRTSSTGWSPSGSNSRRSRRCWSRRA